MVGLTYLQYVCKLLFTIFFTLRKKFYFRHFVYIYMIYLYMHTDILYIYIDRYFCILPTSICTTIMKKKNIYI